MGVLSVNSLSARGSGQCELKPRLRVFEDPQGPHVIGRESDSLRFDWLDLLLFSRQF